VKLILKPHANCGERGDTVEIYQEGDKLPWAMIQSDAFSTTEDQSIFDALYRRKKTVLVKVEILEELN
jgi:hypothetical protein